MSPAEVARAANRARFARLVARPDAEVDLAVGALCIAADGRPGLDFDPTLRALDALTNRVRARLDRGDSADVVLVTPDAERTIIVVGKPLPALRVATEDPAAGYLATLSAAEARLLDQFKAWGVEPERPKDVGAALGLGEPQVRPLLERLLAARRLVKIKPDLYMHADVVAGLRARLVAFLDAHKTIDAQQWKELTGASRKFTIPLAEFFDGEKLTLRVGDVRRKR
jgi:hypothetical protein